MKRNKNEILTINNQAIETDYGIIQGRDALILKKVLLEMYPMEIEVIASLSTLHCYPSIDERGEYLIGFKFTNIKSLTITMLDESCYELVKKSCFDKILDKEKNEHYVLSTYDHIFDVIGQCKVFYYK